jgi:hypothetical protein
MVDGVAAALREYTPQATQSSCRNRDSASKQRRPLQTPSSAEVCRRLIQMLRDDLDRRVEKIDALDPGGKAENCRAEMEDAVFSGESLIADDIELFVH